MRCEARVTVAATLLWSFARLASAQSAPSANDDVYCGLQGITIQVAAPGILANDFDADGDPFTVNAASVTPPSNGTLTVRSDGSFDYTPDAGFAGTDVFSYRARDASGISNSARVTIVVGTQRAVCHDESNFLSLLQGLGLAALTEGFEDDAAWGVTRTSAVTSVTRSELTWRSNHPQNGIRTSMGSARSGSWGLFSSPHGDTSGGPTSPQRDGLRADSTGILFGVGAWLRSNTPGARARAILDDTTSIDFPSPEIRSVHAFFGVVEPAGFVSFELYETEGTAEDPKLLFADDVTLGVIPSVDSVPPRVAFVASVEDTGDGRLTPGEVTTAKLSELLVNFDEPVFDPPGDFEAEDVTNPANYLLVEASADGHLDTSSCITGADPADDAISLSVSSYAHPVAALTLQGGGVALPAGRYRLFVCGATSIRDLSGNLLDGNGDGTGGDDFVLDFTVVPPPAIEPTVLLKVNGLHPDPPVVTLSGPLTLTLTLDPGTVTETLQWYFAIIVETQVYWVTASGVSMNAAPLGTAPPVALNDAFLLGGTLPRGVTLTFVFFLYDGTTTRGLDFIKAVSP